MELHRVGLQKTTLIDYPGLVASTVFTAGCNLRCPFCHNPELVTGPDPDSFVTVEEFFKFLDRRKSVLGGVCITGGEPSLYDDLPDFIERIHSLGLRVKLDTNGTLPEKLERAAPDYIAMDLKTAPEKYSLLYHGKDGFADAVISSMEFIKGCGIEHELRTTWTPGIVELGDIPRMAELLRGVMKYYITPFRPGVTLDPSYSSKPPCPREILQQAQQMFKEHGIDAVMRNS